ncbi:hypothetical protein [Murimonas intestini]|uniref:Uncharacterized protein n=1 Tax=Murimonas intestini TaxID=1337051 RepID=A0AB73SZF6_9FIRM|nr:hypothetical protein [Murimonas intestini]MCR1842781.1 hypothetical protein [Murimonas intestini]MCR1867880.1 hypothetical protein [Murimonas intestini]MCR1885231.1 hypothetical protein [Murimonas intestini]
MKLKKRNKKVFYAEYMEKTKPRLPYCVCKNRLHRWMGTISPSLWVAVTLGYKGEKAENDLQNFKKKFLRYLCYKRKLNKVEWKDLYRECRIRAKKINK